MADKPILKSYYGDLFFEFLTHEEPSDTILFLEGFPSSGSHNEMIKFLYDQGYNIFVPHYRGTYQSKGKFLSKNIVKDFVEFVREMKKEEATNLWDMSKVNFKIKDLIIIGGSFSGAVCCGLASEIEFNKMILFAPVLDFRRLNEKGDEENPNQLMPFVKRAYRNLIRFNFKDLSKKISKYEETLPEHYESRLNLPTLILHDPNDKTVSIRLSKKLADKRTNVRLIEHEYDHGTWKPLMGEWPKIKKFLNE